jgi:sulfide dehydrogenase cytochrome subunit
MNLTDTAIRTTTTLGTILMLGLLVLGDAGAAAVDDMAAKCAECHGKDGLSSEPTVPIIAGYSDFYIIDTMGLYKDDARPCPETEFKDGPDKGKKTDMCKIAKDLSDDDVEALATYYAGKPFVPAKQDFDADKAALGEEVHERHCKKCHEDGGSSPEDDAGILAGQWKPYLEHTFKTFASGEREMPKKMKPKFEKLDQSEIEALINYYVSQQ